MPAASIAGQSRLHMGLVFVFGWQKQRPFDGSSGSPLRASDYLLLILFIHGLSPQEVAATMPAMFFPVFLRCFLLLALLLNGLVAAHAAVQLPVEVKASAHEMAGDMAHEDCHDAGDRAAQAEPQPKALQVDCCKDGVCQCVCATPVSAATALLQLSPVPPALLQAVLPTAYRSVDLARILRPPIV